MQLCINGQTRTIEMVDNLSQLLEQLNLAADRVVVELNQEILDTTNLASTPLQEGDKLELIQFVGGG